MQRLHPLAAGQDAAHALLAEAPAACPALLRPPVPHLPARSGRGPHRRLLYQREGRRAPGPRTGQGVARSRTEEAGAAPGKRDGGPEEKIGQGGWGANEDRARVLREHAHHVGGAHSRLRTPPAPSYSPPSSFVVGAA